MQLVGDRCKVNQGSTSNATIFSRRFGQNSGWLRSRRSWSSRSREYRISARSTETEKYNFRRKRSGSESSSYRKSPNYIELELKIPINIVLANSFVSGSNLGSQIRCDAMECEVNSFIFSLKHLTQLINIEPYQTFFCTKWVLSRLLSLCALGAPSIKPRAEGWGARMLPLCYTTPWMHQILSHRLAVTFTGCLVNTAKDLVILTARNIRNSAHYRLRTELFGRAAALTRLLRCKFIGLCCKLLVNC